MKNFGRENAENNICFSIWRQFLSY